MIDIIALWVGYFILITIILLFLSWAWYKIIVWYTVPLDDVLFFCNKKWSLVDEQIEWLEKLRIANLSKRNVFIMISERIQQLKGG